MLKGINKNGTFVLNSRFNTLEEFNKLLSSI